MTGCPQLSTADPALCVEGLDFRTLPGQNPLFLSYLYEFDRVASFYQPMPMSAEDWKKRVDHVLNAPRFPRDLLVSVLQSFNRKIGAGPKALEHLRDLESSDAVAVVTGQQVGFLGGPSYAVYKAATAIRMACHLRDLGIKAVPVFWLASDDSDFDEIRGTRFVDSRGTIHSVVHPDLRRRQELAAGSVTLDLDGEWWQEARKVIEGSLASPAWCDGLLADYVSGRSFREAYARWMNRVFDDFGLVFFDPLSTGYRDGLKGFFETAVRRRSELMAVLSERNQQLEKAGFSPQVHVEESESFLFLFQEESRFKLEYQDQAYRVKGSRVRFTPEELASGIRDGVVRVAPNVLIRPLVQDYLFPTVSGITGPSEIAYFAQVNSIAPFFDQEPVIFPRAAFTMVDRKSRRLTQKYSLGVQEILTSTAEELSEKLVRRGEAARVLAELDDLRNGVENRLSQLGDTMGTHDPTVSAMAVTVRSKIHYQIEKLHRRFIATTLDRDEILKRHVSHLTNHLKPNGHLQERVLNYNYFLSEGGPGFLARLVRSIEHDRFEHRVGYL